MAEFYITEDDKSNNAIHYVHKSTCEKLPAKSTLRYVGSFANGDAARYKSLRSFTNVLLCSTCIAQHGTTLTGATTSSEKAA